MKVVSSKPRAIYTKDIETGEIRHYASIQEAVREGFLNTNIHRCLRGELRKYRGRRWAYCDGQPDVMKADATFAEMEARWQAEDDAKRFPDVEPLRVPELTEGEVQKLADECVRCAELAKRVRHEGGKLYWTASQRPSRNGQEAGTNPSKGYRDVYESGFRPVRLHRLVFFMHHGYLPKIVDHIDGDTFNNAIENLRAASSAQNTVNCKVSSRTKTGHKGVTWRAKWKKWYASISVNRKAIGLGSFDKLEDAIAARKAGEEKYHGEFARK